MANEKKTQHHHDCCGVEEMTDFETYMAMKWGTPKGIASVLLSVSVFILSIGVFLWLLHLANIIK